MERYMLAQGQFRIFLAACRRRTDGDLRSQGQGDRAPGHLRLGARGTVGDQAGRSVSGRWSYVAWRATGREQFAVCVDSLEISLRAAGRGRFYDARARDRR